MPLVTTYHLWLQEIARITQTSPSDPSLLAVVPGCIDYAELRIYRDLQLARNISTNATTTLTANSPNWTAPLSSGLPTFIIVQEVAFITPVATQPDAGTRNPLRWTSKDLLDIIWPTRATQAAPYNVPQWIAPVTDQTFIVVPTPDAAYVAEVTGSVRPAPLTAQNPTTVLLQLMPDLFIAACMVFLSGWQKNFSSSGDDPNMAVNWESEYSTIIKGPMVEEAMKKMQSAGWTPYAPAPVATPTRG